MRPAALPRFRKLYGKVNRDFKKGDSMTFTVTANYEVDSFDGTCITIIDTIVHHILPNYTNDAYI
jgi:hypothetical protein